MNVSYNWLKDYVDVNKDIKEFCDRMIMSGSNLETCTELGTGISDVVIGKIEKIEKHPDADKLVVCTLNVGDEDSLQIVTGADNVFEGAYVPVAKDGSHLPGPLHGQPKVEGGVTINKGTLRGVESCGMLCGASELGIDEKVAPYVSKDGIWILPEEAVKDHLGEEIQKAMDFKDYVIDFEITPNRPDCLSMLGMAAEAAATFGGELKVPDIDVKKPVENVQDYISVEVKSDLCKRYTARVIKDVKIEQSPWWMQKKLMAAGVRPVNNIVDITNWVMMEYGQPLHAFDINDLEGSKIIVDTASQGEKITTLDGQERELNSDMLMIKDGNKSVAVAGVMGGENSEIKDETTTVVLESANFLRSSVRKTSKQLGLRTEASSRYEKGIDPNLCKEAANRFCHLVEVLGAGTVVDGIIDVYPEPVEAKPVKVRVSRVNKVMGTNISRKEMVEIIKSLRCEVEGEDDIMIITPPTVRQDLNIEEDFIEEVARIYGYDKLPMTLPKGNQAAKQTDTWRLKNLARQTMCAMGADEIQTYSFISPSHYDKMNLPEGSWEREYVSIINPLGEDTSVMRTILSPLMIEVLSRNYSRKVENVRAFEIGTTFLKNIEEEDGLPLEQLSMCIGAYGDEENFFTLKGMVKTLLTELGISTVAFIQEKEYEVYHPGRCARILGVAPDKEIVELGIMGEIHPDVAKNYNIDERVYVAELMFDVIEDILDKSFEYKAPPKYPAMERDIAVVVDEDISIGNLEFVIKTAGTSLLREVKLFDIYRGQQVEKGKKSVAFNLIYRHDDRTLTDEETDRDNNKVIEALCREFNAVIRDN